MNEENKEAVKVHSEVIKDLNSIVLNRNTPEELESNHMYILSSEFGGQQTCASHGITSMQCWAGHHHYNALVVEPFFDRSYLYTPFPTKIIYAHQHSPAFSDLIDIDSWNAYSRTINYAELIGWGTFLLKAPRNVIVVDANHCKGWNTYISAKKKDPGRYQSVSNGSCTNVSTKLDEEYLTKWNFRIVREMCIECSDEYSGAIFGEWLPTNTTVVFKTARNINRMASNLHCSSVLHHRMMPSKAVQEDAETYIARYLKHKQYIALMVRMEKTVSNFYYNDHDIVHKCFQLIPQYLERLKTKTGITTVFLATDMGENGSAVSREDKILPFYEPFLEQILGTSSEASEWEQSFSTIARIKTSGYIALLQMWIAVKSQHLLLSGGGTFQSHTMQLFNKEHGQSNDHTISWVTECTRKVH